MQTLPGDRQKTPPPDAGSPRVTRQALAAAFASFNHTAGTLETTYLKLQGEVSRLRHELENKNRRLAQSLEENQRMRAYLAGIVESLPCGVLVFDAEMHLRLVNPAASRLLGAAEVAATSLSHPLGALLAALPKEEFIPEQEWVVEGSETPRTIGVTRALMPAHESANGTILILRDLTEAKQLELAREAARRAQALAEVATLLAHEIRNPLASLELFAGLLADARAAQPEWQTWINHIQAGLRSLAATVNNVLHFHNPSSAELRPVDLVRLVGETVDFLRPLAAQKRLQLAWYAPGEEVSILADPSRLQQVFLNLALNAFRAMTPGGTLAVSVSRCVEGARSTAQIRFADQGVGISAASLPRIFEPGFTTQNGSPGLGLAVTRKVIEQHHGTIRVESREGQGTTFTLALPLAAVPAMASEND